MTPDHPHIARIARELSLRPAQVLATANLLEEGGTVPFIARYRKEATGLLDEVAVAAIRDRLALLQKLDERRAAILESMAAGGHLTDVLKAKIEAAETLTLLEDIYQPFRPKRRTRATMARARGLEPLADSIARQDPRLDPQREAARFVTAADVAEDVRVPDVDAALAGARDILAERISDDPNVRARVRGLYARKGQLTSKVVKGKEQEGARFRDYFDWAEPLAAAPSHRVLALLRGAAEGVLNVHVEGPDDEVVAGMESQFVKGSGASAEQMRLAVADAYKRLLSRAMETEARGAAKERADAVAIEVFAQNLRQLLLASPLGHKRLLAIDPGFRTGCKTVVLDAQGQLLHHDVIYPEFKTAAAESTVKTLVARYKIEAIAIGNGTASRETEAFVRKLGLPAAIPVVMVSEAGASIYSASEVAREEFPDLDLTLRGAVSIGRRLMDPLAELVKLDPKSIGVGQYQHDVDQDDLKKSLDDVVISCVNAVGVDVNSASRQLLTYVSGLNATIAGNLVEYRNKNGPFTSRKKLLEVPRLGKKTFEQCAGFLRIHGARNPLDASAVHPESYPLVDAMSRDLGVQVTDLMSSEALRARIDRQKYVTAQVGLPTIDDIIAELARPGRDPREQFEAFQFAEGVSKPEDLEVGQKLPGIVTNVTAFGAFVDIGVHQDGLVHISQLADRYVRDPNEVVKVAQKVEVTVLEVDLSRRRIALSMKKNAPVPR